MNSHVANILTTKKSIAQEPIMVEIKHLLVGLSRAIRSPRQTATETERQLTEARCLKNEKRQCLNKRGSDFRYP